MKNTIIMTIIVAVVIGVGAFFGGMQYQRSVVAVAVKQPTTPGDFGNRGQRVQGMMAGGQQGARPVNGDILSVDDNSVTIKLADGSSKIIVLSESTPINKATTGSVSDLKVGDKLMIFGTTNSDGSVTATNVSINTGMPGASESSRQR